MATNRPEPRSALHKRLQSVTDTLTNKGVRLDSHLSSLEATLGTGLARIAHHSRARARYGCAGAAAARGGRRARRDAGYNNRDRAKAGAEIRSAPTDRIRFCPCGHNRPPAPQGGTVAGGWGRCTARDQGAAVQGGPPRRLCKT
jgi:hypothetical protein